MTIQGIDTRELYEEYKSGTPLYQLVIDYGVSIHIVIDIVYYYAVDKYRTK